MNLDDLPARLGRRDFLRSAAILGTGTTLVGLAGGCGDRSPFEAGEDGIIADLQNGSRWMSVEAAGGDGVFVSLDAFLDDSADSSATDLVLEGHLGVSSGDIIPLGVTYGGDYAGAVTITDLDEDLFRFEGPDGMVADVRIAARTIADTGIIVVTGQTLEPLGADTLSFNITLAPTPEAQLATTRANPALRFGLLKRLKKLIHALKELRDAIAALIKAIRAIRKSIPGILDLIRQCVLILTGHADVSGRSNGAMGDLTAATPYASMTLGYNDACTICGHEQGVGS